MIKLCYIINPKNNKKIYLGTNKGINILKQYIYNYMNGGMDIDPNDDSNEFDSNLIFCFFLH